MGSSRARIPQFRQKVSARARRMIRDASTYTQTQIVWEYLEVHGGSREGAHPENIWYLLTGTAATPHIQSCVSFHHNYSVVVNPPPDASRSIIIHVRPDLHILYIWGRVGGEAQRGRIEKERVLYIDPNNIDLGMGRTSTPVGAAPQVSDDLVDLIHLHAVEFHDGSAESRGHTKHCVGGDLTIRR